MSMQHWTARINKLDGMPVWVEDWHSKLLLEPCATPTMSTLKEHTHGPSQVNHWQLCDAALHVCVHVCTDCEILLL